MRTYLIGGDAHNPDGGLSPATKDFLSQEADEHIFIGDLFNLLELGVEKYRFSPAITELTGWARKRNITIVAGNHDPYEMLREITPLGVTVVRSLDVGPYHLVHGHQFGGYWKWLSGFSFVQKYAPSIFAGLAKRGIQLSTPSVMATGKMGGSDVYVHTLGFIWAQAMAYSQEIGKWVIMGHTHWQGDFPSRMEWKLDRNTGVIDLGTITRQDKWLEVEI